MTRDADLLQGMEGDPSSDSQASRKVAFPVPNENLPGKGHRRLDNEAALTLVQRIFLQKEQSSPRIVAFVGVDHGNGCSETAASVAETLASDTRRGVCLVEANFRSPSLHTLFGTTNLHGLADSMTSEMPIRHFISRVRNSHLWLLSSGPTGVDSPDLLTLERLTVRFKELRAEFDFVIVDTPPMSSSADAIVLGRICDGIVLVVEAESTRREAALTTVETFRSCSIPVLAAVLNKRTFPIPQRFDNML
jgi:succinoglycan biosynthesis transport protein ExoP